MGAGVQVHGTDHNHTRASVAHDDISTGVHIRMLFLFSAVIEQWLQTMAAVPQTPLAARASGALCLRGQKPLLCSLELVSSEEAGLLQLDQSVEATDDSWNRWSLRAR